MSTVEKRLADLGLQLFDDDVRIKVVGNKPTKGEAPIRTGRGTCKYKIHEDLLFISGLNIDISPDDDHPFPLTKFAPWAAYASLRDGRRFLLEQEELTDTLRRQSNENPDRLSFDSSIRDMAEADEIVFEGI